MPEKVLNAYESFLESLVVRNTIVGGIGTPYKRPTGVPQGDPFSMMVAAMITRPWLVQMKEAAVKPRILADDLQLLARGPNHLEQFQYAFDATHKHLHDMGAKIAPKKSVTFSSDWASRKWLKQRRWRRLGTTVTVLNDMRDLGAHFNSTSQRRYGATLTARMRRAAAATKRLGKMRMEHKSKPKSSGR